MLGPPIAAADVILVRLFLRLLAVALVVWGAAVLPLSWLASPVDQAAADIIKGELFRRAALDAPAARAEALASLPFCYPSAVRSRAVIRLRFAEDAFAAGNLQGIDAELSSADQSIRQSLGCAPADPYLWLALFWVESTQNGFRPSYFEYLRLSYLLGPHEGWIALKRNRVAFAIFEQLPEEMRARALDEFVGLVKSGFYGEAADILIGPAWRLRDEIVNRLGKIPVRHRQFLADMLATRDADLKIPGAEHRVSRPW
jgi:hypothetical protein